MPMEERKKKKGEGVKCGISEKVLSDTHWSVLEISS
jgi:hypothetical protein